MKRITISMPEDLLQRCRQHAGEQGVSLNEFILASLRMTVGSHGDEAVERLMENSQRVRIETKGWRWDREEAYKS